MKNKKRLKKWVENTLIIILFILVILLMSDSQNIIIFITSKITSLILIYIIGKILINYTNILK